MNYKSWYDFKKYMTVGNEDYENDLENRICKALDIISTNYQEFENKLVLAELVKILIKDEDAYKQFVNDYNRTHNFSHFEE